MWRRIKKEDEEKNDEGACEEARMRRRIKIK